MNFNQNQMLFMILGFSTIDWITTNNKYFWVNDL